MEKAELQKNVDALKKQLKIERVPVSKAAGDLKAFCESNQDGDPLVNPVDKKHNPWAEKSKCTIL